MPNRCWDFKFLSASTTSTSFLQGSRDHSWRKNMLVCHSWQVTCSICWVCRCRDGTAQTNLAASLYWQRLCMLVAGKVSCSCSRLTKSSCCMHAEKATSLAKATDMQKAFLHGTINVLVDTVLLQACRKSHPFFMIDWTASHSFCTLEQGCLALFRDNAMTSGNPEKKYSRN